MKNGMANLSSQLVSGFLLLILKILYKCKLPKKKKNSAFIGDYVHLASSLNLLKSLLGSYVDHRKLTISSCSGLTLA